MSCLFLVALCACFFLFFFLLCKPHVNKDLFLLLLCVTDDRWDYFGSTIVTNNYVRLTPDQASKRGAIWNRIVSNILICNIKVSK